MRSTWSYDPGETIRARERVTPVALMKTLLGVLSHNSGLPQARSSWWPSISLTVSAKVFLFMHLKGWRYVEEVFDVPQPRKVMIKGYPSLVSQDSLTIKISDGRCSTTTRIAVLSCPALI